MQNLKIVEELAKASLSRIKRWVAQDILIATREAYKNAVEHGSRGEESYIELILYRKKDKVFVIIKDEGCWREEKKVFDNLDNKGRGMLFMKHLMDKVKIRKGKRGTTVFMEKRV